MSDTHHHYVERQPVVERRVEPVAAAPAQPVVHREAPPVVVRQGSTLTTYAIVKYAFILAIVIVVLYFVARYIIPLIGD